MVVWEELLCCFDTETKSIQDAAIDHRLDQRKNPYIPKKSSIFFFSSKNIFYKKKIILFFQRQTTERRS